MFWFVIIAVWEEKKLRHCQQSYQVLGVLTSYSRRDGGTDKFKKVCILPSFPSTWKRKS